MASVQPLRDYNEIKIFILYLLYKIGYPLDYGTIGAIVMQDGMVSLAEFSECFYALVDAGSVECVGKSTDESFPNPEASAEYRITDSGKLIATELRDSIYIGVRDRGYRSALRHLSIEKRGAVCEQSYRAEGDGYLFECSISDSDGVMLETSVRVDNIRQLRRMRRNFELRPEVVYRGIIALLSGDVNYIFEGELFDGSDSRQEQAR